MPFCPNCGTRLPDDAHNCPFCGTPGIDNLSPRMDQRKGRALHKRWRTIAAALIGAVLLSVGVIFMLNLLIDDGKESLYGRYVAVDKITGGIHTAPDGEWIELHRRGRGRFYMGYAFDLKWRLEGEEFSAEALLMGIKESVKGQLQENVLYIQIGDVSYTMLRQGTDQEEEMPELDAHDVSEEAATGTLHSDVCYQIHEINADGIVLSGEALLQNDLDGAYLLLCADGTAEVLMPGAETAEAGTWKPGVLHENGVDVPLTLQGNTVQLTLGTTYMIFVNGSGTQEPVETKNPVGTTSEEEDILRFEGDWYGIGTFYNGTNDFAPFDGLSSEVLARIVFTRNGGAELYLRMALGEGTESLNFRNIKAEPDLQLNCLFFSAEFLEGRIEDNTCITVDEDGFLYIDTTLDEGKGGSGTLGLKIGMRRLGDSWRAEDQLCPSAEQLEKSSGMSLEMLAEAMHLSREKIPATDSRVSKD